MPEVFCIEATWIFAGSAAVTEALRIREVLLLAGFRATPQLPMESTAAHGVCKREGLRITRHLALDIFVQKVRSESRLRNPNRCPVTSLLANAGVCTAHTRTLTKEDEPKRGQSYGSSSFLRNGPTSWHATGTSELLRPTLRTRGEPCDGGHDARDDGQGGSRDIKGCCSEGR